jgi:hypothetical protein
MSNIVLPLESNEMLLSPRLSDSAFFEVQLWSLKYCMHAIIRTIEALVDVVKRQQSSTFATEFLKRQPQESLQRYCTDESLSFISNSLSSLVKTITDERSDSKFAKTLVSALVFFFFFFRLI